MPKAPLLILSRLFSVTDGAQVLTFRHLSEPLFCTYTEAVCEERRRQILICQEFHCYKRLETDRWTEHEGPKRLADGQIGDSLCLFL
jgi:hypothetical protein